MNKNEAFSRVVIDAMLAAQGWQTTDPNAVRFEVVMPDSTRADYVLCDRHGRSLAVIEAKAWDKPLTEGVGQAKSYAAKLAVRFTYATNGQAIYGIDMATGAEGNVVGYPSPDELWKLTFAKVNAWRDR